MWASRFWTVQHRIEMAQGWGFVEAVVERCSGLGFRGLGVDGEGRCAENLSLRQSESCLPQFSGIWDTCGTDAMSSLPMKLNYMC